MKISRGRNYARPVICSICRKKFIGFGCRASHCSDICRKEARSRLRRKPKIDVLCSTCGTNFKTTYVRPNNYCSKGCYSDAQNKQTRIRASDPDRLRCTVKDCDRAAIAKGYCGAHWQRKRHGRPLEPPIQVKKTNGEWDNGHGYIVLNTPEGYKMKHRVVMEQHLGRPIKNYETVHHKNGIRSDNRLVNLELWSSNHPSGQRVEDLKEWAWKIIEEYDPVWES